VEECERDLFVWWFCECPIIGQSGQLLFFL